MRTLNFARGSLLALSLVAISACGSSTQSSTPHDTTCVGLCAPPSIDAHNGILGGQFGYNSATINFSSTFSGASTVAKFWTTDPAHPVAFATINSDSSGSVTLAVAAGTFTFTGHESSLSTAASTALHDFDVSDVGQAIARIPFAVGGMSQFVVPAGSSDSQLQAITTNAQQTGQLRAALVLPLQLQNWYDPTFVTPTPSDFPETQGLNLDDDGNPYVIGYWTLGDGSNLSDASFSASVSSRPNQRGYQMPDAVGASPGYNGVCAGTPKASYCRGACGVNCNHCKKTTTQMCNAATMMIEQTDTYVCPTAPCCNSHDGCYDTCKNAFNCGNKAPGSKWNWNRAKLAACLRGCDAGCIATWGAVICGMHIFGGGGTGTITFTNTYSIGPCES